MTATSLHPPTHESARRLPRDLALVTVAIDAVMVLVNLAVQLAPDTPEGAQMRGTYALPGVWIPMVCSIGMVWVLAAALAWSHGRNALEKRGVDSVSRLARPRLRYAAAYLVVLLLNFYALSPLLYEVQLLFMPGGRLHEAVEPASIRTVMAVFVFLQSIAQLIVLVLGVWAAAWVALRAGRAAPLEPAAEAPGSVEDLGGASPRRAVALVGAAMFAALQMWSGVAMSRWSSMGRGVDGPELLFAWMVPPLVVFALAFWGGWLGAAPGLARARPFRAVAASVLAFVLVQVSCIVIAIAWLYIASSTSGLNGLGGLIGFVLAFALVYAIHAVMLMRAATRWLYRRYL